MTVFCPRLSRKRALLPVPAQLYESLRGSIRAVTDEANPAASVAHLQTESIRSLAIGECCDSLKSEGESVL